MDSPAHPSPQADAEDADPLPAVERLCALIDALCAAVLAELCPRTWWGVLFCRVSRPMADRVGAMLRGMSESLRAIAADVSSGVTHAGVGGKGGGGWRAEPAARVGVERTTDTDMSGPVPDTHVVPRPLSRRFAWRSPPPDAQPPAARPDAGSRDKPGHDDQKTIPVMSPRMGTRTGMVIFLRPAANRCVRAVRNDAVRGSYACRDGPLFSGAVGTLPSLA